MGRRLTREVAARPSRRCSMSSAVPERSGTAVHACPKVGERTHREPRSPWVGRANKRLRMNGDKTVGPLALQRIGEALRSLCRTPTRVPFRLCSLVAQLKRITREGDYLTTPWRRCAWRNTRVAPTERWRLVMLAKDGSNSLKGPGGQQATSTAYPSASSVEEKMGSCRTSPRRAVARVLRFGRPLLVQFSGHSLVISNAPTPQRERIRMAHGTLDRHALERLAEMLRGRYGPAGELPVASTISR